jgi:hypothetical protein
MKKWITTAIVLFFPTLSFAANTGNATLQTDMKALTSFLNARPKQLTDDETLQADRLLQSVLNDVTNLDRPTPEIYRDVLTATYSIYVKTSDQNRMDDISFQVYEAIIVPKKTKVILDQAVQLSKNPDILKPFDNIEER